MKYKQTEEKLADYLCAHVYNKKKDTIIKPNREDVEGFNTFMRRYKKGLGIERAAVDVLG